MPNLNHGTCSTSKCATPQFKTPWSYHECRIYSSHSVLYTIVFLLQSSWFNRRPFSFFVCVVVEVLWSDITGYLFDAWPLESLEINTRFLFWDNLLMIYILRLWLIMCNTRKYSYVRIYLLFFSWDVALYMVIDYRYLLWNDRR